MKIEDIAKLMLEELKNSQNKNGNALKIDGKNSAPVTSGGEAKFDSNRDDILDGIEIEIENIEASRLDFTQAINESFSENLNENEASNLAKNSQSLQNESMAQFQSASHEPLNLDLNQDLSNLTPANLEAQKPAPNPQGQISQLSQSDEEQFLLALKERILVLFEGLNAFDRGDIEARVELSLKFMEFLLASIDNRVKNLQK